MASKLTGADISEITNQSDLISKYVRDNFTNTKNKINEVIDDLSAATIGATNAETTAARPYNTDLKERLDQIQDGQSYISTGGVVTINGGDPQKVDVTAVTGTVNGIQVKITAATSATIAFSSANTRFDVVVANSDSTFSVVTGAESATPELPDIATTQKPLWVLTVGTATVALSHDARDQGCWYQLNGETQYEWKLQDAIDNLTNGGTIKVGNGIYYENITYDNNLIIEFDGNAVIKNTSGTTINFDEIDLSGVTGSLIKWKDGVNRSNRVGANNIFDMLPVGAVISYAGTSTPDMYLLCDGSAISRTTYSDLFTAIGTAWGVGDGSTTFNVPDLRGMFLRGTGTHGSATMANGGAFSGPSVGSSENDKMQGHYHNQTADLTQLIGLTGAGALRYALSLTGQAGGSVSQNTLAAVTDGTNGSPRLGDETNPVNYGVTYIIKY